MGVAGAASWTRAGVGAGPNDITTPCRPLAQCQPGCRCDESSSSPSLEETEPSGDGTPSSLLLNRHVQRTQRLHACGLRRQSRREPPSSVSVGLNDLTAIFRILLRDPAEEGPLIERKAIYKDGKKLLFNRSHQSDSRYRGLHLRDGLPARLGFRVSLDGRVRRERRRGPAGAGS